MSGHDDEVIRVMNGFPGVIATGERAQGAQRFDGLPNNFALELLNRFEPIATENDPFALKRSAPAVYHLVKVARQYYSSLNRGRVISSTFKANAMAALVRGGEAFVGAGALKVAFKFVNPRHRFGSGDKRNPVLDPATQSDPDFIARYIRKGSMTVGLSFVVKTTHWFIEQKVLSSVEGDRPNALSERLRTALCQDGFVGEQNLGFLVKLISWEKAPPKKSPRKTASIRRPAPLRVEVPGSRRRKISPTRETEF